MTSTEGCPRCGSRQVDEYTHADCPLGSTPEEHTHFGCGNSACEYEWVEPVVAAPTPEEVEGDAGDR